MALTRDAILSTLMRTDRFLRLLMPAMLSGLRAQCKDQSGGQNSDFFVTPDATGKASGEKFTPFAQPFKAQAKLRHYQNCRRARQTDGIHV